MRVVELRIGSDLAIFDMDDITLLGETLCGGGRRQFWRRHGYAIDGGGNWRMWGSKIKTSTIIQAKYIFSMT